MLVYRAATVSIFMHPFSALAPEFPEILLG
jgi:hypothetical protein